MVKSRRPPPPSRSSPCPPLASLTLPPLHRKPSKSCAPIISSFKRSPLLPVDLSSLSMDPKFPCNIADSSLISPYGDGVEEKTLSRPEAISNTVEQFPLSAKEATSEAGSNEAAGQDVAVEEERQVSDCGRQRLQDHWIQVGGKVSIPDTWGREQHLQDWVSFGFVEDALRPAGLMSARSALMSECQRGGNEAARSTTPAMSADVEVSYG